MHWLKRAPLRRYCNFYWHWCQFIMKTYVLINKNVFLNTAERLQQQWYLLNYIFFVFKNCSVYCFRDAPCMFLLVLHKDASFNWHSKKSPSTTLSTMTVSITIQNYKTRCHLLQPCHTLYWFTKCHSAECHSTKWI